LGGTHGNGDYVGTISYLHETKKSLKFVDSVGKDMIKSGGCVILK